jgi:UDP-glucose 4-epimerase
MISGPVKNVLIIGGAGGLSQLVSHYLIGKYEDVKILSIDQRRKPFTYPQLRQLEFRQIRYTRSQFEKVFRENQFDVVYHLGRLSHIMPTTEQSLAKRLDANVMGTRRVLGLCRRHGVKTTVILSTFHTYGALPDNPVFLSEEAPLRAAQKYSDIRDIVAMDRVATSYMWKYQNEMNTLVLRPCNIIGPNLNNAMTNYLTAKIAPYALDFNPIFQFIFESDMAQILVDCIHKLPTGVYNIAPEDFISIRDAIKIAGGPGLPFPMLAAGLVATPLNFFTNLIPEYLIDYLKYSCLIDNELLTEKMGNPFKYTVKQALESLRL